MQQGLLFVSAMPEWVPYTPESGATMLFDNQSELVFHHDKELLEMAMSVEQPNPFE